MILNTKAALGMIEKGIVYILQRSAEDKDKHGDI